MLTHSSLNLTSSVSGWPAQCVTPGLDLFQAAGWNSVLAVWSSALGISAAVGCESLVLQALAVGFVPDGALVAEPAAEYLDLAADCSDLAA